MLSKTSIDKYKLDLNETKVYCSWLKLAANNYTSKIKTGNVPDNNQFHGAKINVVINTFIENVHIAAFLMIVSKFEHVFYLICISQSLKHQENFSEHINNDKFLEVFLTIKKATAKHDDFYSFSFVKEIIIKMPGKDIDYINEIIALRNYCAHGRKKETDLEDYDTKLINNTDDITTKFCAILDRLEQKP